MGKITEASALTIQLDATPSGPSTPPPPSSPNFTPDALPVATLPIYPGLGQAPNMLDCLPGGYQDTKLLNLFSDLFSRTTWISHYQKGRTILNFNEARDDGVALASAGLYANHLNFAATPER